MADERIDISVNARDNASGPLSRARFSLDDLGDTAASTAPKVAAAGDAMDEAGDEAKGLAAAARLAEQRLKRAGNAAVVAAAKLRLAAAMASSFGREMGTIGGGGGSSGGRSGGRGAGGYNFKGFVALMAKFKGLRIALLFSAIASAIPAVVAGISGLAAGAIGLFGALKPLAGLIVAYPGYLAAFGQAFAAVKLAFSGLGEALESFRDVTATGQEVNQAIEAFAGVGARSQVIELLGVFDELASKFDVIKGAVQVALLPAVSQLGRAFDGLTPLIGGALQQTGGVLADIVRQFTSVISSPQFGGQLAQIMGNNLSILRSFGDAALSAFGALVDVLVAAGPMLTQIARDVASFFQKVSAGVSSGDLAGFFAETYGVARQLVDIFKNVGAALMNIAEIGKPLGDAILVSFQQIAQSFRDFTESGSGVQTIRDWFIEMTPVVYEIGYLIRDVAKALASVSDSDSFLTVSGILRERAIPALVQFIDHAKDLLPPIVEALSAIIEFAAAVNGLGGLQLILSSIATVFGAIAWAVNGLLNGPLRPAFQVLAAFFAMWTLGRLMVAAIGGIKAAFILLKGVITGATAAVRAFKMALISTGIGAVIVGVSFLLEAILNLNGGVESQIEENKAWAASLFDVSGAMTETSAHAVAMKLANDGLFDVAEKAGISNQELVSTLLQGGDAVEELLSNLRKLYQVEGPNTFKWERDWFGNPSKNFVSDQAYDAYLAVTQLEGALPPLATGITQAGAAAAAAAPFMPKMADGMDEIADSTAAVNESIQEFMQLLDMLDKRASWRKSLMSLEEGIKKSMEDGSAKGMFKKWTEEGEDNLSNLNNTFKTTMDQVTGYIEAGNQEAALKMIDAQIKQVQRIMDLVPKAQQGPIQTLLDQLMGVRSEIETDYTAELKVQASVAGPTPGTTRFVDAWTVTPSVDTSSIPPFLRAPGTSVPVGVTVDTSTIPPFLRDPNAQTGVTVNANSADVATANTAVTDLNTGVANVNASTATVTVNYVSVNNALYAVGRLRTALEALDGKVITITVKTVRKTENARAGGPIFGGGDYRVGERGPEMFISAATGLARMIGTSGQQLRRFNEDGYVIPNHQLPGAEGVQRSAASAVAAMNRGGREERELVAAGTTVHIGQIVANKEIDVVQAVRKGIARAERDRQERA